MNKYWTYSCDQKQNYKGMLKLPLLDVAKMLTKKALTTL